HGPKPVSKPHNDYVLDYVLPGIGRERRRALWSDFGSSVVAQSGRSSTSLSVIVNVSVLPSIATWPKNCSPKLGARLSPWSRLAALWKITCGPKVRSRAHGVHVPAWIGPETN